MIKNNVEEKRAFIKIAQKSWKRVKMEEHFVYINFKNSRRNSDTDGIIMIIIATIFYLFLLSF